MSLNKKFQTDPHRSLQNHCSRQHWGPKFFFTHECLSLGKYFGPNSAELMIDRTLACKLIILTIHFCLPAFHSHWCVACCTITAWVIKANSIGHIILIPTVTILVVINNTITTQVICFYKATTVTYKEKKINLSYIVSTGEMMSYQSGKFEFVNFEFEIVSLPISWLDYHIMAFITTPKLCSKPCPLIAMTLSIISLLHIEKSMLLRSERSLAKAYMMNLPPWLEEGVHSRLVSGSCCVCACTKEWTLVRLYHVKFCPMSFLTTHTPFFWRLSPDSFLRKSYYGRESYYYWLVPGWSNRQPPLHIWMLFFGVLAYQPRYSNPTNRELDPMPQEHHALMPPSRDPSNSPLNLSPCT